MHGRTTFLLLVLVILLGAWVAAVEWGRSRVREPQQPRPAERLLDLDPEHVEFWSFLRDGLYIECVREHGRWMLRKPVAARADTVKLNHRLGVMAALPRRELVTAAQLQSRALSPADYGLQPPAARMALGNEARRHILNIGGRSPLGDAVYVQFDGSDAVMATSTNLLEILPRSADELRDARVVPGSPDAVRALELKPRGRALIRVVREGPEWIIRKPIVARADFTRMAALLDQLFALEAQQFVTDRMEDPNAFGLSDDEALLRLHVWQDEEPDGLALSFANREPAPDDRVLVAVRGTGSVMAVPRAAVDALAVPLETLRDARLYFMSVEAAGWIQLEEGEQRLQLRKLESGWQVTEPVQWKADPRLADDLVNRLNALRIEAVLAETNLAALGLDPPARRVCVAESPPPPGGPAGASRVLALSRPQPGRDTLYAIFIDEPPVYQVSAASVAALSLDPLSYRDGLLLVLAPGQVTRITQRRAGREQTAVRTGAALWAPVAPESGRVLIEALRAMLTSLESLRVLRYERPERGDLGVYGLQEPRASVTVSLSGEEGIRKTIMLGDDSEDSGVYAMVQGQDVVCVLPRGAADALLADIVQ